MVSTIHMFPFTFLGWLLVSLEISCWCSLGSSFVSLTIVLNDAITFSSFQHHCIRLFQLSTPFSSLLYPVLFFFVLIGFFNCDHVSNITSHYLITNSDWIRAQIWREWCMTSVMMWLLQCISLVQCSEWCGKNPHHLWQFFKKYI